MYLSGKPKPSTMPIRSGLSFFNKTSFKSNKLLVWALVIKPPSAAGSKWPSKKLIPNSKHKLDVIYLICSSFSLMMAFEKLANV